MPNFDHKTGHLKLLMPESRALAHAKNIAAIAERNGTTGGRLAKAGQAAALALTELQEALAAQGKAETPLLDAAAGQSSPPAGQGGSDQQPEHKQPASPPVSNPAQHGRVGRGSGRASGAAPAEEIKS
jgi:hypothetical protein